VLTEVAGSRKSPTSVMDFVQRWISDFYNVVRLVKRLDRQEGDFLKEMEEDEEVRFFVHRIVGECERNAQACKAMLKTYSVHRPLWTKDINLSLEAYLAEAMKASEEGALRPDLAMFDAKIAHYKSLEEEIKALPPQYLQGWLKIDARPIKSKLQTWVSKWAYAHTNYLEKYIVKEIDDLLEFVARVNEGLSVEVEENDAAQLIAAMTHVRNVRVNQEKTDRMFDPLRNTISLLKRYNIHMPDEVLERLEGAPFKWEDTKKTTLNAREMLGPLQSLQQEKVKEDVEDFKVRVADFVGRFNTEAPFEYARGTDAAYLAMSEWNHKLMDIEAEAVKITEDQELFEVTVSSYKEIGVCRQNLKYLKIVWDHVQLVQEIFAGYRATLWTQVDVDKMMDETKKLQKEVKALPRPAQKWNVFAGLTEAVNNMTVSLPLIQDLRDDAMRERHWNALMVTCGKSFVMDSKLQLDSLLQLNLHLFLDGVSEVVEQARAEIKLDLQLQKIMSTWSGLALEYAPFKSTGVNILQQPSEVYEALDDNEVVLQNMMGNRFMGFFEATITEWKGKLGTVRSVLEVMLDVQRSWCSLESIFLGSEDIREQLPEDAKRFDGIDAEFREQMADASTMTSPIEVCTAQGREEALNKCQANLELCQKSLSDYLEVKKKRSTSSTFSRRAGTRPPCRSTFPSSPTAPAPSSGPRTTRAKSTGSPQAATPTTRSSLRTTRATCARARLRTGSTA